MAIITNSKKFEGNQPQACILAGGHVILRAIYRGDTLTLLTATASEPTPNGEAPAFPNQLALIDAAFKAFEAAHGEVSGHKDLLNRPYLETTVPLGEGALIPIAQQIAATLGLEGIRVIQDEVLAELWSDATQNPHDETELVYVADGMYTDKWGNFVRR